MRLSFTAAVILKTVAHGVRYGFEIMERTGLPSGTVYPALRRLERDSLVSAEWETEMDPAAPQRPPRRYYRLTAAGRSTLADAADRYPILGQLAPQRRR